MNYKTLDQVISAFVIGFVFMLLLSIYFAIDIGLQLNIKSDLVITYVFIPVVLVVFFVLQKLNLTLIDDLI
jgi:hypothetical protein